MQYNINVATEQSFRYIELTDAKIWISKIAPLCRVLANQVTYAEIFVLFNIKIVVLFHNTQGVKFLRIWFRIVYLLIKVFDWVFWGHHVSKEFLGHSWSRNISVWEKCKTHTVCLLWLFKRLVLHALKNIYNAIGSYYLTIQLQ